MKLFADFLQDLSSQLTKNGYIAAMFALMDAVYRTSKTSAGRVYSPEERKEYLKKIEDYLKEDRNFFADLITLKKHIERKAPRTQRSYLYSCKSVIENCTDRVFTKSQEKNFKTTLLKGTRKPISETAILTHEDIRSILNHSSILVRAAILTICTSGIRIGELVQLEIAHFDLNGRKILIPAFIAKTKEQRTTYITQECAEALKTWLKFRPQYMDQIQKQCVAFKPTYKTEEMRMFPMTATSLRNGVSTAVSNAGLKVVGNTHRSTILPNSFRKWFNTTASLNMTSNPVELIMGHELPYGGAYVKMSDIDIEKVYRKYESCLFVGSDEVVRTTIDSVSGDMQKILAENTKIKKDYEDLKKVVAQLVISKMEFVGNDPQIPGEENIHIK